MCTMNTTYKKVLGIALIAVPLTITIILSGASLLEASIVIVIVISVATGVYLIC